MHLDASWHFIDKEFIKKYLDVLALHKMNVFHWHLTDDQGWRIEIDGYPELTKIGAWRKDEINGDWKYEIDMKFNSNNKYGGFYTKDDITEIINYAEKDIFPSFWKLNYPVILLPLFMLSRNYRALENHGKNPRMWPLNLLILSALEIKRLLNYSKIYFLN